MKNINKYENLAAYEADANRPTDENTVSLIKDINIIKRKGVNVIVPSIYCSVGDTVVYDTVDMKYKVIKNGTVNSIFFRPLRHFAESTITSVS